MTNLTSLENSDSENELNRIDIVNAVTVIDFACEQGAFKSWEVITQVQGVRDKLQTFINETNPPDYDYAVGQTSCGGNV
ncbi:MAG: hypothetical protein HQ483_07430 [Rhodospirillales bacterium]|nr:hypothetical protein [Rhodospirillales bacterium]